MEARFMAGRKKKIWAFVQDGQVLEVGVGTSRNIEYYPPGANINRRTVENVERAELVVDCVDNLTKDGIVKPIFATRR